MRKNGILFRVASGLLAAALTLSLTACGGSSSNSDASVAADSADSGATHLRLIYSPSLCAAPMYIAIENGYFADENIELEQVTVDAAHVGEAIGADQVDVGMELLGKMLQPIENGLPIKFTTGIHTGCTKLLVPGDSDIKSIADLKGKTVCVGDVGSGTEINAWQVLGAAGLTKDDVNAVNGSFQDGVDQLKDGKIDAAFTVAGAPTTAIVDYATTNTLNLVSLTDEELAAIQEAYPFLIRDDLPSTTYTGMTGDVVCVAIQATLVASKDLSEDVVYEFVKAMFDNKDALTEGHAKFGFLDPETASAGATVTMHPGAEKYYKEIGVL